jgi:hypothetical protein
MSRENPTPEELDAIEQHQYGSYGVNLPDWYGMDSPQPPTADETVEAVEIGYVCRHGHFQFKDDPDGDACVTKIVGRIFVMPELGVSADDLNEAVEYSLTGHHRKMEE